MIDLEGLLAAVDGVSLDELDERAALLRRVDNKYALPAETFVELAHRLASDHEVLVIDDRRVFSYSTTYFETPDRRCFIDHVEDRVPRFKVRSRFYEDSGQCVFEVKLKRGGDETDKRQIDYEPSDRRRLTDQASECLRSALSDAGLDLPEDLKAVLTTAFRRVTLASRGGSERLTCDFDVRLVGPRGEAAEMRTGLSLVETKSETGDSPADRELKRLGYAPISLSKYRVGMSLVGGAERFGEQPGSDLFAP